MVERIIDKLLSGRLWITLCAGIVFVYCSVKGILTPETIAVLVTAVIKDYFTRPDRGSNGNS